MARVFSTLFKKIQAAAQVSALLPMALTTKDSLLPLSSTVSRDRFLGGKFTGVLLNHPDFSAFNDIKKQ
ncbi:MAG: hypothetical protein A3E84_05245 [Gammaproteobacteria bacterium RIFCSPHIGHO2_12_FULL_42_13]|nr:MAG: hypothetical protein A3E84_05245 [Gammaproteobacteria bacterium RIFCSPHIGHO2_12_FULL_42_13]